MSSLEPTVSVGLPYFNDRAYLGAAIRSVLLQSYGKWELILVNDGSTDGSNTIAESFTDPRIRLLSDSRNLGLAYRLNQIAGEAKGRFLFRMDSDDMMHPERIQRQLGVLVGASEKTVVGSAAVEIDEHNRPLRIIQSRGARGVGYHARNAFLHPTVAAHTTWFRRNPYSEEPIFRRVQDAELWVRTAATSQFLILKEPLLFYRRSQRMPFDRYLWQAMALLKILSQPESGGCLLRLSYSFLELTKLQLRFIESLRSFYAPPIKRFPVTDPVLGQYNDMIGRIFGR